MNKDNISIKHIEELGIDLTIRKIPVGEIEDILAALAGDRGYISRNFYEDFIIANCIANINQLLFTMSKLDYTSIDLSIGTLRKNIYDSIIEVNPMLDPKNIYVNHNGVLKRLSDKKKKLSDDEFMLADNKMWEVNNYEDLLNKSDDMEIPVRDLENEDEDIPSAKDIENKTTNNNTTIKKIEDLEYNIVESWWKRLGQYIKIKQFKEEDALSILSAATFDTRTKFSSFISSLCVVEAEEIYEYLDKLGTPEKVHPPILMHELYDLCRQVNPFLTFDKVPKQNKTNNSHDKATSTTKKKSSASMSEYAKDNRQKPRFRDLPKKELLELSDNMKVKLIGQDDAIHYIVESVQRASVGLKDPEKPIGSFLFAGPTGCGKTLTSKVLAENLVKDKEGLVIVDCSEYSAEHEYSKLIGAPSGYIGHEQGGYLTNAVSQNPFSVVVFDEVEKASSKIHELLLQVLDEGRLTDGKGQVVSFKDTIIIMTSNIGVKEVETIKSTIGFGDVSKITDDKKDVTIEKAIKKKFRPEFINRIDSIVYFQKLKEEDYLKIIDIELNRLNEYLKNSDTEFSNVVISFDNKVRNLIYKEGIDDQYGARPLKRCIERRISTPLALKMLNNNIANESHIKVSVRKKDFVFDIIQNNNIETDINKDVELTACANGEY
jgi:ATP-dependent Clp protease ATP-binding subunit ClpC